MSAHATATDRRAPARGVWLFPDPPGDRIVAAIVAAEHAGLDEVWLGDEGPGRDPFALLAAAAVRTERIRLGVAVTNPYLRHPAVTAATALTVQELSEGRFTLGLGAGGGIALDPVGLAAEDVVERVGDAIRIARAVTSGTVTNGYRPVAHGVHGRELPVVVGARGPRLNRLASEAADGVFLGGIPVSMLATTIGWAHEVRPVPVIASFAAAFSPASFAALHPQLVWPLADAPAVTRRTLGLSRAEVLAAAAALGGGDPAPALALLDDRLVEELAFVGSPEEVGARLASVVAPLAPASVVLNLHGADDPVREVLLAAQALDVVAARLADEVPS